MIPLRSGLPDAANVAGQYRLHADRIANGETDMPANALLVELNAAGALTVTLIGQPMDGHSIKAALLAAADSPSDLKRWCP